MLSKAFKGIAEHKVPCTATRCVKLPPTPNAGTPIGSLGEEVIFDWMPAEPVQQQTCHTSQQSPFPTGPTAICHDKSHEQAHEADDTSAWLAEGLEDDNCSAPEQTSTTCMLTAAAPTSMAHQHLLVPAARSHHSPWHGMPTTSAPTISATLASTSSLHRTALSAVSMAILAEDEEYTPSNASHLSSSIPRCRSLPVSIAPTESTSLVTRMEQEKEQATDVATGSTPIKRNARNSRTGLGDDEGFQPPHEMVAASYSEAFANPSMSRRQSIANRLKSVVFEQTGMVPSSCSKGFLG